MRAGLPIALIIVAVTIFLYFVHRLHSGRLASRSDEERIRVSSSDAGPLADVVVLDLSTTFMGPYCTLFLAQLGARVIKVESPRGDVARYIQDDRETGLGPTFMNVNRGKESVTLDLKSEFGREALDRLIAVSDVLLHNLRPGASTRLGLDFDRVSAVNDRIIYCAAHGYGSGGPYREKAAYDDVVQAASGVAAIQGGPGEPEYVRSAIVDKTVGIMAFAAIASALYERERSGLGQHIEVPMFEAMASFTLVEQQGYWVYNDPPGPPGYPRTESLYRKPYRTANGHIGVLIYTDAQWKSFFDIIGRPDLVDDPRYTTIRERTKHIDELYQLVEKELLKQTTDKWLEVLDRTHIPAMPVNTIEDLFTDPHLQAVGFFEEVKHPSEGDLIQTRLPWTYSRSRPGPVGPAPALGSDTVAVLRELGYIDDHMSGLGDEEPGSERSQDA